MKTFWLRTISASVFASIMLVGILWNHWSLAALVVLINAFLLNEFYKLFEKKFSFKGTYYVVLGSIILLLCMAGIYMRGGYLFIFTVPIIVFLVLLLELSNSKSFSFLNVAIVYLGWIYITVPLLLFALMGNVFEGFSYKFTLSVLAFVWINDIFAYLIGSWIGKTKVAPRISPKKSVEGLIGGIVFTLASSIIFIKVFADVHWIHWLALAAIASVFSILGDLIESKFKRDIDIKDTGSIMPGHGGLLDRFDAFLYATPFYFIYLIIFVF